MVSNVADLVRASGQRVPERTALADGHETRAWSWGELDAAVERTARGYVAGGVRPGDRVVIETPTTVASCVAVFAALRAGAVVVPLGADSPLEATSRIVAESGARFGIGVDGPEPLRDCGGDGALPDVGDEDIALLCFTSGTTTSGATAGRSGVRLSHRALLANVAQCARIRPAPVVERDRVLLCLPLQHIYGLSAALFQIAGAGATAVLLERFHADEVLSTIERFRITSMLGVPPMYAALLERGPERLAEAMPSVRLLTSGAAPLPETVRAGIRAATGLPIFEGYGLSEAGPVVTWSLVSGVTKPGSVGRPIPGVEVELVDTDGRELPEPDESGDDRGAGRVAVRGLNLFSGYWPDGAGGPDTEGWFVTGDYGYTDEDGDLHLVDREHDLIIVNGFNVYPHEVERALAGLDGVREVAVVGVPDERTGESVKAVLVADGALSPERVREHCATRLPRFKVPSVVEFLRELPHSPTGKVLRRKLRI